MEQQGGWRVKTGFYCTHHRRIWSLLRMVKPMVKPMGAVDCDAAPRINSINHIYPSPCTGVPNGPRPSMARLHNDLQPETCTSRAVCLCSDRREHTGCKRKG